MIYVFWNSVSFNFFDHSRCYPAGKYYTYVKSLAYLVKLLCLLGFVEPTGPNSSLAEISLLVEIWLCCNFYHSQEKGNYLVRIITGIRKLPKGFQKPRYTFIFFSQTIPLRVHLPLKIFLKENKKAWEKCNEISLIRIYNNLVWKELALSMNKGFAV